MIKNTLSAVQDVSIYPIISLCIFGVFFLLLLVWMWRLDKKYIKEMKDIPLQ